MESRIKGWTPKLTDGERAALAILHQDLEREERVVKEIEKRLRAAMNQRDKARAKLHHVIGSVSAEHGLSPARVGLNYDTGHIEFPPSRENGRG